MSALELSISRKTWRDYIMDHLTVTDMSITGSLTASGASLLLSNGSATSPSLSFVNDTNTGFYYDPLAPDNIQMANGGVDTVSMGPTGLTFVSTGAKYIIHPGTAVTGDLTVQNNLGSTIIRGGEGVVDAVTIMASNPAGGISFAAGGSSTPTYTRATLTTSEFTLGNGIKFAVDGVGTNAMVGTATLVAGTVTISNVLVTAASRIFLTRTTAAGTALGELRVSAVSAGVSFTVEATNPGTLATETNDTSSFNWFIVTSA